MSNKNFDTERAGKSNFESPNIRIKINGRLIGARQGQTIAGVLHEKNSRTLTRGIKYHRPRGYVCGFGACGNCVMTINGIPDSTSCTKQAEDGDVVETSHGLPSTRFDLLRFLDIAKPLLPAGFQFRLFTKQPRLAAVSAKVMGHLAGGGKQPSLEAVRTVRVKQIRKHDVDTVVIGGGMSGIAAALGVASSGRSVAVVDERFDGGRSQVRTEPIFSAGQPIHDVIGKYTELLNEAIAHPLIEIVRGTAIGLFDNLVPVINGSARHEITSAQTVVATGSYEVPKLFSNNDRPGVMLADGALKLAEIDGISPGRRIAVATDSDRGHDVAHRLRSAGSNVVAIVDSRASDSLPQTTNPVPVFTSLVPTKAFGWSRVRSVEFETVQGEPVEASPIKLHIDALIIAGERRPSEEFTLQVAYAKSHSHEMVTTDKSTVDGAIVGTARGDFNYDIEDIYKFVGGE